jgi:large subunit ribosomal protein L28
MSRRCSFTGKGVQVGNRVSHSNTKTKHRFLPNLQERRLWSSELKRFVRVRLCTAALRTVDKLGLDAYARKVGLKLGV